MARYIMIASNLGKETAKCDYKEDIISKRIFSKKWEYTAKFFPDKNCVVDKIELYDSKVDMIVKYSILEEEIKLTPYDTLEVKWISTVK
jgi:hypothetical protein